MLSEGKVPVHQPYTIRLLEDKCSHLYVAPETIGALIIAKLGDFDGWFPRPDPVRALGIPSREQPPRPFCHVGVPVRGNGQFQDHYQRHDRQTIQRQTVPFCRQRFTKGGYRTPVQPFECCNGNGEQREVYSVCGDAENTEGLNQSCRYGK